MKKTIIVSRKEISRTTDIATTIMSRDYKGFGNQGMNGVVEWKNQR